MKWCFTEIRNIELYRMYAIAFIRCFIIFCQNDIHVKAEENKGLV